MSRNELVAEQQKRRHRIDLIKKMVVGGILFLIVFPIIMCIFMMVKISKLESKLDDYVTNQENQTILTGNEALVDKPSGVLNGTEANETSSGDLENKKDSVKRVYLTFDDGPSVYTGEILDILEANDVKATFFVIARDDDSYSQYYNRIVEEGHTLGMHSYTHVYSDVYASKDSFIEDVTSLQNFLYEKTGIMCNIYRFPGGSSNTVSNVPVSDLNSYLNASGITYYDWNALNGDAVSSELSPEQLVNNVMKDVRKNNNSVVLMHDLQSRHTTVESLQTLIDTLKNEGYEILPIDSNTPLIQHISSESVDYAE